MKNDKRLSLAGLVGLMIASTLTIMVGSAIVPALPKIAIHYNLGNLVGWLVTVPSIGVVVFSVFFGKLIDKIGAYHMILIGLIFSAIFGASGYLMPTLPLLLIDRFLLGAATSIVIASSTNLISQFYTGEKQLKMIAIQGMVIQLGGVLFLTLSGSLAEINWYSSFYIYLIALIPSFLIFLFVPNVDSQRVKNNDIKKLKKVKSNTSLFDVLFITCAVNLIFFTAVLKVPSFLQNDFGYSSTFTGNYLAAISLIAVFSISFIPKIVKKFSAKTDLIIGSIAYMIGHIMIYNSHNTILLFLSVIFMGIGFGLTQTLLNDLVVVRSDSTNKGVNLSLYSLAMFSGQIMASVLCSIVIGAFGFLVCSFLAFILSILIFFFVHEEKERIEKNIECVATEI